MPKVTFNKDDTGSIIYDQSDWLAGINSSSSLNYSQTKGNPTMNQADPLRFYGYVSPGALGVAPANSGTLTSYSRNATTYTSNAYLIGAGSQVNKMDTASSGTVSVSSPFPHTITHGAHTTFTGSDIAIYFNGSTQLCSFFSWNDNTDWNVGICNHASSDAFDDDFMSTVPTTPLAAPYLTGGVGYPHPLVRGVDDVLYIGDRNFVHAYDWTTNTFTAAVLTLPQGWVITSFCNTQDLRLAIGYYENLSASPPPASNTFNSGNARVAIWDFVSDDPDYSIDLKDNYVSELMPWNNTIVAFTTGPARTSTNKINKLQELNGTVFQVIKTYKDGTIPVRGGVDNVSDDLYWNGGGYIYSWTKELDSGRYILNNIAAGTPTTPSGFLRFFTELSRFYTSFNNSGDYLQSFNSNAQDNYALSAAVLGQSVAPEFPVKQRGELTQVTIKFASIFSGGRSMRLNTELDDTQVTLISDFTSSTNQRLVQIKVRSDGTPLGSFSRLAPVLVWGAGSGNAAAPVVDWIRYDFELTNYNS